jgi:hypothetical protein
VAAFAISVYEFGGDEEGYFVSENERLWEWLIASNCTNNDIPAHLEGHLRVLAPEGFVFYDDMLVPLDADILKRATEAELKDWGYVAAKSPEDEKGTLLILSPYHFPHAGDVEGVQCT